jgi:hypothetical protein
MTGVFGRLVAPSAQVGGQRFFYGAIAISVLLHAVIAVALVDRVYWNLAEPEVEAISVDLVPPPEPEAHEQESPEPVEPEKQVPEPSAQPEDRLQPEEQLARSPSALPLLKPVIEFSETDSGPRIEPDGQSKQEVNETELDEPAPEPEQLAEAEAAPDDSATVGPVAIPAIPKPRPVQIPATAARELNEKPGPMIPAKQLFSQTMLGDPRVQTAMAKTPRAERGKLLCMTELRGQLLIASPPRPPEILPSIALPAGTVLEHRQAAFRSQGQWFDLAFRCEVDEGVTKVLSFSYRVGDAIPRAEWAQRGFPGL